MEIIIKISQLLLSLSILVVLHEMGHFLAAKMFNTKVEKFYLFFNPWFSLFKKKIGDTTYGIGWLPLGGYVKIAGMIDESMDREQLKKKPKPWEFRSKPRWQRLIIMIGGVAVNFVFAFVIYTLIFCSWGVQKIKLESCSINSSSKELLESFPIKSGDQIISIAGEGVENKGYREILMSIILWGEKNVDVVRGDNVKTVSISENDIILLRDRVVQISPQIPFKIDSLLDGAAKGAGLQKGDVLVAINDQFFSSQQEFSSFFKKNSGSKVSIKYNRNGKLKTCTLKIPKSSLIGVLTDNGLYYEKHSFFNAIPAGLNKTKKQIGEYIGSFGLLFSKGGTKQLGGFISIGNAFSPTWDWYSFWMFTAFLSIMLAIINLLPIPALDGGHVLILLIEIITGREFKTKALEYIQVVGLIILFGLFILANVNDVIKLFQ